MYIKAELDFTWVCIERVSKAIDSFEDKEVHEKDNNVKYINLIIPFIKMCPTLSILQSGFHLMYGTYRIHRTSFIDVPLLYNRVIVVRRNY